jgi:hypothetical protein
MNFKFYLEKLKQSDAFKKFIKTNPKAYMCSGFFIIDKEGNDNKQHIDFFIPGNDKISSFELENKLQIVPIEMLEKKTPEKLSENIDFDFEELEKMIFEEMKRQGMDKKIQKIILSLQSIEGKPSLVGTIFVTLLGLIKIRVDVSEMKILEFEKKSFFDMMKRVK